MGWISTPEAHARRAARELAATRASIADVVHRVEFRNVAMCLLLDPAAGGHLPLLRALLNDTACAAAANARDLALGAAVRYLDDPTLHATPIRDHLLRANLAFVRASVEPTPFELNEKSFALALVLFVGYWVAKLVAAYALVRLLPEWVMQLWLIGTVLAVVITAPRVIRRVRRAMRLRPGIDAIVEAVARGAFDEREVATRLKELERRGLDVPHAVYSLLEQPRNDRQRDVQTAEAAASRQQLEAARAAYREFLREHDAARESDALYSCTDAVTPATTLTGGAVAAAPRTRTR